MGNLDGMLTPAQATLFCDAWATALKNSWTFFGTDAPTETTTLSYYFDLARKKTLGDGPGGSYTGLGSPAFEQNTLAAMNAAVRMGGYDVMFQNVMKNIISQLDSMVTNNLPGGWKFATTTAQNHAFDFYLTRLNAVNASTPATPGAAGTLAGVNYSGGQMAPVASGSAPRVCHTLVGPYDYIESLPSAQATQVAIASNQNAYTYTIAGTVPTGLTKVRIYRGYYSGAVSVYYWLMDVTVTPGASYPTIYLIRNDQALRPDIAPPSWFQLPMTPEFAAEFALAYATAQSSTTRQGQVSRPIFSSVSMLSPLNVALGPAYYAGIPGNGFMGVGNAVANNIFDTGTVTAANTIATAASTPQSANVASSNVQGYAGATGLQFRLTTAATGGTITSITISYHYLQASTGQASQGPTTLVSGACSGTAIGSTCAFTLPAGAIVTEAHITGYSGTATAAVGVLEGVFPRSY